MKANKLKTAGLIALLSASMSAHAVNATEQNTTSGDADTPKKNIVQEDLTIAQMEEYIKDANIELRRLARIVQSAHVKQKDYEQAWFSMMDVRKNRDEMQKKLDAARAKTSTIMFNDASNSR